MRGKNTIWMALMALLLTSLLTANTVTSSPGTELRAPTIVDKDLGLGATFNIDINVSDVIGLVGWNVRLNFNPMVLQALTVVQPDPNFLGPNTTWSFWLQLPVIDNFLGTVKVGDTFYPPPPPPEGVSGSGTLATITFEVIAENATTLLSFDPENTGLYKFDPEIPDIPFEAIDGFFDNRQVVKAPVADFTFDPLVGVDGLPVTFDASTSTDPDGGWVVSYFWDFGDGTNATGVIVDHTYMEGAYTVTLTVTDIDGLTDDLSGPITVVDWMHTGSFVDLVEKCAWPEDRQLNEYYGRTMDLYAKVGNPTGTDVLAYVEFTILSKDEVRECGKLTTDLELIPAYDEVVLSAVFDTHDLTWQAKSCCPDWIDYAWQWLKKYYVFARCYTFRDGDWKSGNIVKQTQFKVAPVTHDIAILETTANVTEVSAGQKVRVDVVVENQGTLRPHMDETFDIRLRYKEDEMWQTVHLDAGENKTVTFIWDSTDLSGKTCVLWAELPTPCVIYENDWTENTDYVLVKVL